MSEPVDDAFCIIEDPEEVELFLGKKKLSKEDRADLEVDGVPEFEI